MKINGYTPTPTQAQVVAGNKLAAETDTLREMLQGTSFDALCDAFVAHIEGRPDIDADKLMETSNKIGRIAWAKLKP